MSTTLKQEELLSQKLQETAKCLLTSDPGPHSPFGSFGELEHVLDIFPRGDFGVAALARALARIARQRGVTEGDAPFEWVEEELTHKLRVDQAFAMCEALVV